MFASIRTAGRCTDASHRRAQPVHCQRRDVQQLDALLAVLTADHSVIVRAGESSAQLPEELRQILTTVLSNLIQGTAVTVEPHRTLLTTQEAADILGIPRPTLVRLLTDALRPSPNSLPLTPDRPRPTASSPRTDTRGRNLPGRARRETSPLTPAITSTETRDDSRRPSSGARRSATSGTRRLWRMSPRRCWSCGIEHASSAIIGSPPGEMSGAGFPWRTQPGVLMEPPQFLLDPATDYPLPLVGSLGMHPVQHLGH